MEPAELAAQYPFFKDFPPQEAEIFLKNSREVAFPKGTVVFQSETPGDIMYFLLSGTLKIYRVVKGREITLGVAGPGELCGEMSLVDDGPRSASARSVEDVKALAMTKQSFQGFRDRSPGMYLRLLESIIRSICLHLRQTNQTLEVIRFWIG